MSSAAGIKSKNAKAKKIQKKIIRENEKKRKLKPVAMLVIATIVVLFSINILHNLDAIKKNDEYIYSLEKEYNHKRINNEALRKKAETPIDDEYIREFARENGYRDIDEDMYYLNESE
ncbi:MAG: hypothetical protein FWG34_07830 [Oscillospiraceae bacterium]|nr:hypothetical protein [Oscillospiraceae bacterium]